MMVVMYDVSVCVCEGGREGRGKVGQLEGWPEDGWRFM